MLDKKYKKLGGKIVIDTLRIDQKHYIKALENSNRFSSPEAIESLASNLLKMELKRLYVCNLLDD